MIPTQMNCEHAGEGWCLGCVEKLHAENVRLRAIVDRLPTTADGVPITPGMKIYPKQPLTWEELGYDGPEEAEPDSAIVELKAVDPFGGEDIDMEDIPKNYSSLESAAAALASQGDAPAVEREGGGVVNDLGLTIYPISHCKIGGRNVEISIAPELRARGKRGVAFASKTRGPHVLAVSSHLPPAGPMMMETFIHEALHLQHPQASEKVVQEHAHELARMLWKLGYRLATLKQRKPRVSRPAPNAGKGEA
jgi:hypothetical protein